MGSSKVKGHTQSLACPLYVYTEELHRNQPLGQAAATDFSLITVLKSNAGRGAQSGEISWGHLWYVYFSVCMVYYTSVAKLNKKKKDKEPGGGRVIDSPRNSYWQVPLDILVPSQEAVMVRRERDHFLNLVNLAFLPRISEHPFSKINLFFILLDFFIGV